MSHPHEGEQPAAGEGGSEREREGKAPRPPPPPQEAGGAGTGAGRRCRRGLPAGPPPPPPARGALRPPLCAARRALRGRCGGPRPRCSPRLWLAGAAPRARRAGPGGEQREPRTAAHRHRPARAGPRGSGGDRGLGCLLRPGPRVCGCAGLMADPAPLGAAAGAGLAGPGSLGRGGPVPSPADTHCLCGMGRRIKDGFVSCGKGKICCKQDCSSPACRCFILGLVRRM